MSTSIAAAAPAPTPPPNLPNMSNPDCDLFPPVNDTASATTWWNETFASPQRVCSSGNSSYVAPCCAQVGGEARGVCGRVMCLTDQGEGYFDCVSELRKTNNDSESLVGTCEEADNSTGGGGGSESAARPVYVRPVCAALAMSVLAGVVVAL